MRYRTYLIILVILSALTCFSMQPFAQEKASNKDQPLIITANKSLEWNRTTKQYIARGNAIAKQGTLEISADLLTGEYANAKGKTGSGQITKLIAEGNVVITSEQSNAIGDRAIYDVIKGQAVMTGGNLKMTSVDQTVTATDRFEYWVQDGKLSAHGNAVVERGDDKLTAESIAAWFVPETEGGARVMDRAEATGNVVITTPTDKATGDKGTYSRQTNTAELLGKVKIENGQNILEGNRAVVDLATNISKMFAGSAEDGRVKGTFYPGSSKKPATTP